MKKTFAFACFAIFIPFALAYADQGGFTNSGGSLSGGSSAANPPGTLTIGGGALAFRSTDGTTAIDASFSSSSTVERCSGGGRGGHVTCAFTFTGTFSGTLTVNGATQAINGATSQRYRTDGVVVAGTTGYNSAYTPFYFSNTGQILRSDDLNGSNLISYGTQGSDVGQFYGAYGIAVDSAGRIYVADTYNARIVRIDDMNGTNWISFGTYGSDIGQFNDPSGVSIDAAGGIYVMDTGNARLVRMDDMNGANWTTFSGTGSGVGQFAQYVAPVALDASGRIYVADTGNRRIVRMDDMSGANWATLTQSPVINSYIFSFGSPIGVAVDAAGGIYVADSSSVVRVDDMAGTNWTSISLGSSATPHSIAVDSSGMVLVGGGGAQIVDNMVAVLTSSSALTQFYGPYYVFGATPVPLPTPRPSAIGFSPPTLTFSQNTGTTSAPQTITIANFGGSPLNGLNLSAGGGFSETNDCPAALSAGSSCTVSVAFTPQVVGPVTGALAVTDDSGNLGSTQAVPLDGTGTTPGASVTPATLSFSSQAVGTTSTAKNITLQSTGTGPLQVTSIVTAAPFSQTNNCSGSIAPAASCTIQVTFAPTAAGSASGIVTITDNAGTQTVGLTGGRRAEPD
jgi:sugar lactone lactonase YvrE